MKVLVSIGVALLALTLQQPARADDTLAMCKAISDNVAEAIRDGDLARANRSKPELEKCIALQRAAVNREAQRIVDSAKR